MTKRELELAWESHLASWSECKRCELHEGRLQTVLAKGSIPCDILFIGEAPGESENVCGEPFIGPAGKLLDEILEQSVGQYTYCLTNLVACIPRNEDGGKLAIPDGECIETCAPRLIELATMCQPKLIVCVGNLAETWLNTKYRHSVKIDSNIPRISIKHPSAIKRGPYAQQPLDKKRAVITIKEAIYTYLVKPYLRQ